MCGDHAIDRSNSVGAEEQAAAEARLYVEGVSVGSIMTPHPVIAPGWLTVDAFLEDYLRSRRLSNRT